jgi:hypothetical protein
MIIYDYLWLFMITYDYLWLIMMIYDYLWLFMIIYDYLWLCMIMYDYLWLSMYISCKYGDILRFTSEVRGHAMDPSGLGLLVSSPHF